MGSSAQWAHSTSNKDHEDYVVEKKRSVCQVKGVAQKGYRSRQSPSGTDV